MRCILLFCLLTWLAGADVSQEGTVTVQQYKTKDGRTIEGLARDNPKRTPGWMIVDLFMNGRAVGTMELHRDDIESQTEIIQTSKAKVVSAPVATDQALPIHDAQISAMRKDFNVLLARQRELIIQFRELQTRLEQDQRRMIRLIQAEAIKTQPITESEVVRESKGGQLAADAAMAERYNEALKSLRTQKNDTSIVSVYEAHPRLSIYRPHPCPVFAEWSVLLHEVSQAIENRR